MRSAFFCQSHCFFENGHVVGESAVVDAKFTSAATITSAATNINLVASAMLFHGEWQRS
jgi:hypothetical protein